MSKDLFSAHASDYAKYRPTYPVELVAYVASFAEKKGCALDCATGNGQAAVLLAEFFDKVFATDFSEQQIEEAQQHPRVTYLVSTAEATPFRENTFDAITIAQAYHWVNHQKFAEEVKRIGKRNAVVAVFGYNLFRCENQEVTKLVDKFYYNVTDPYWEPERKYVENSYRDAPFDFPEIQVTQQFKMRTLWTIAQMEGYLNTWSAIKKFIKVNDYNPVSALIEDIKKFWGDKASIPFDFPLALRIGRLVK
jgi:ubiquinone/menaquinone biosynthesis C-methylase UbiE